MGIPKFLSWRATTRQKEFEGEGVPQGADMIWALESLGSRGRGCELSGVGLCVGKWDGVHTETSGGWGVRLWQKAQALQPMV